MGLSSKPMWPGQLELRVFFFFPPEALSVAVTRGAVLLRPRGRDGPVNPGGSHGKNESRDRGVSRQSSHVSCI